MSPSLRAEFERLHAGCCAVRRVREKKCSLSLPRSGHWIAVSGTRYSAAHSFSDELCDVMLAWQEDGRPREVAAVFELKAKATGVSHIQRQLQNGARLLERHGGACAIAFSAVLVHGGMKPVEYQPLRSLKVDFCGVRVPIQTLPCGGSTSDVRWSA